MRITLHEHHVMALKKTYHFKSERVKVMTRKVELRCLIKKITVRTVLEKLKLEEKETF